MQLSVSNKRFVTLPLISSILFILLGLYLFLTTVIFIRVELLSVNENGDINDLNFDDFDQSIHWNLQFFFCFCSYEIEDEKKDSKFLDSLTLGFLSSKQYDLSMLLSHSKKQCSHSKKQLFFYVKKTFRKKNLD